MIIDRRLNDRNKSAVNRQRFIRRYKEQLRKSVADIVADRSITDMERGGDVSIPARDISEPTFHHGQGGDREVVHPGNHQFQSGDRIRRPEGGASGGGQGSGEGGGEQSEDSFVFTLSRDEFMQLFFDDLELPAMARTLLGDIREFKWRRAGYTPRGVPTNLAIVRSLKNSLARRIALKRPLEREHAALLAAGAPAEQIELVERRMRGVPFLDELDLRYRHRVKEPQPISRAVMFCLMDVSASMTEDKKDLAKRFFTLLYLFLTRKYETVDIVFIRHTEDAEEVDEERFFYDTGSGGTVVLSALRLMSEIVEARYPTETWNIYGAQVSDGDAFGADPEKSRAWLQDQIMPRVRYFAYVEVPDNTTRISPLSHAYRRVDAPNMAMATVMSRGEVYPVLRELFRREAVAA